MNIDLNACLQVITVALLMVVAYAIRNAHGSNWIMLGFEVVLLTLLIRSVDRVVQSVDSGFLTYNSGSFLTWFVIVFLYVATWQTWKRRDHIRRVEAELKAQQERIEATRQKQAALLAEHERKMDELFQWSDDAAMARSTEALNNQILQALSK